MSLKSKFSRIKIVTVLGTRPEIIRMSRIIAKLDRFVDQCLVYTNQSFDYEMSQIFFEELKVRKPDYVLSVKSETLAGQISNILQQTEEVFIKEKPDAVVVLGDTNSALSTIVARRMKILIFHLEAGNRCFDYNVPEEVNRKIIDHISDVNMAYSEQARTNLLREGLHPGSVYAIGSPMREVLSYYEKEIRSSGVLKELNLRPEKYFLVSIHREENVGNPQRFNEFVELLNFLAEYYRLPVVVSLHPRTRVRFEKESCSLGSLIRLCKPFGFFEYVNLQRNALCVLSDSGTIPEESAILGLKAVQVRVSSERPEAYDKGCLVLSGLNKESVANAIELTLAQFKEGEAVGLPDAYADKNVSTKVVKLVSGLAGIRKYGGVMPPRC